MVVGRTNESEERTRLLATNGDNAPDGYEEDFVLEVAIETDALLTKHLQGIDAIHATGSVAEGAKPPANGIVCRGLNGVVGYPHQTPRDKGLETDAQAGVYGAGGSGAAGVFGRGRTGIVGCEDTTPRDAAFEAGEKAGVLGRGEIGVTGDGVNGAGVHGRGQPGVRGDGVNGLPGVSGDGGADGGIGVLGHGQDAAGVHGVSDADRGGIFQSRRRAQVWLVPLNADDFPDPSRLPRADAGELCVTITQDVRTNRRPIASLWFCTETNGPAGTPVWVKVA
jgi:hypothetical protein